MAKIYYGAVFGDWNVVDIRSETAVIRCLCDAEKTVTFSYLKTMKIPCGVCGGEFPATPKEAALWKSFSNIYGKNRIKVLTRYWQRLMMTNMPMYKPWENKRNFLKDILQFDNAGYPGFLLAFRNKTKEVHPKNITFASRVALEEEELNSFDRMLMRKFSSQFIDHNENLYKKIINMPSRRSTDADAIEYVEEQGYRKQEEKRVLLIEGVDCSGKDTLIEEMRLDKDVLYWHNTKYKSQYAAFDGFMGQINEIKRSKGKKAVLNRGFISEIIYSKIDEHREGLPSSSSDILESELKKLNTHVILCKPPLPTILDNWRDRIESEMIKDEDKIIRIYYHYRNLDLITKLPITVYDYTCGDKI